MFFFFGGRQTWGYQLTRRMGVLKLPPFQLEGREAYRVASCLLYSLAKKYIVFFCKATQLSDADKFTNYTHIYIIYSRMMTTYYWCLSDSLNDDVHQTTLTGAFTAKEQHRSINQDVVRVTTAKRVIRHQ